MNGQSWPEFTDDVQARLINMKIIVKVILYKKMLCKADLKLLNGEHDCSGEQITASTSAMIEPYQPRMSLAHKIEKTFTRSIKTKLMHFLLSTLAIILDRPLRWSELIHKNS
ncbi:hypothetical protein T11_6722 [Trichinella zimbabwensis]|uniref:Uncharacterized protein n=1 Tax=Trichinella zimbabwensis TaxID=268475 RepID=A0A0V1HVT4_9BILA|nr:hypothetical protein T11_6722 [Trichinella zimbabwensis]